jgi:hypothetical protein
MKCSRCGVKIARIAIIDKEGFYTEDGLFCCECLVADMKEKLAEARKNKGKEVFN